MQQTYENNNTIGTNISKDAMEFKISLSRFTVKRAGLLLGGYYLDFGCFFRVLSRRRTRAHAWTKRGSYNIVDNVYPLACAAMKRFFASMGLQDPAVLKSLPSRSHPWSMYTTGWRQSM